MRNATPTNKNKSDGENDKNSAKKLVQARLPFKILSSATSPSTEKAAATTDDEVTEVFKDGLDARKRKLSYDSNEDEEKPRRSGSKENVKDIVPKKPKVDLDVAEDIVLLDDTSDEESSKINTSVSNIKTPKNKNVRENKKSAGSGQKLTIKLPLNNSKKNKRRKSTRKQNANVSNVIDSIVTTESSDEIEMLAGELNPQKRKKQENPSNEEKEEQEDVCEIVNLDSSKMADASGLSESNSNNAIKEKEEKKMSESPRKLSEVSSKLDMDKKDFDSDSPAKEESHPSLVSKSKTGVEDVIEIDHKSSDDGEEKESDENSSKSESSKCSKNESFVKLNDSLSSKNKTLTPKQQKLLEQRRKAREEKERKIAEERRHKQLEKEEKELAKKREREEKEEQRKREREEKEEQKRKEKEEKEEQRRQEKEEKDEQKRKEREEKEKKRLAEIEAKKKRTEAKEEEQRKKDEERRRREIEKEEAELKKRKAAEAFTKFFVAKPQNPNSASDFDQTSNDSNSVNEATLAFRPFQIKGDMKMAPILRKSFTSEAKNHLDALLGLNNDHGSSNKESINSSADLYLEQLKLGKFVPEMWKKRTVELESKDEDVILVEDELEREGQEIIEESHPPVEHYRAKFYKFYENRRPPYYGTWRKKSDKINPRKPFVQDQKYFDYEIDSDLEWEEEEPGESLDGSDDDKEKESEDEDYEVDNDWFVPHGHLSEEEMQNEDEIGGDDDNTREAQKAKLKLLQQEFAQEMKKKTEKIKPRLVGCVWVDENGNHPDLCPKIIWEKLDSRAMLFTEPPLTEEPLNADKPEPSSPSTSCSNGNANEKTTEKLKPIVVNDKLQKELIRLIHGNTNSKAFLIKEFIAFVEANEESVKNGDVRGPLKSAVRDKIDEFAEWKVMELNEILKKTKKVKKYLCWVVNNETLEKMDMKDLDLKNEWQYLLTPKRKETSTQSSNEANEPISDTDNLMKQKEKEESNSNTDKEKESKPEAKSALKKKNEGGSCEDENEPASKKKRVPLLMSVARGQQFASPAKNALISQFLKKSSEARQQKKTEETTVSNEVIVLE